MKLSLYELVDPITGEIKYVGISTNTKIRYKQHLSCKINSKKLEWINKLKSQDLKPIMNIIDESEDIKYILNREIELIDTIPNLLNTDKGGGFNYCTSNGERTIAMYSMDGEFLKRFEMATEAARYLNLDSERANSFSACALRKRNYAHGYIWRFDDDEITSDDLTRLQYSLENLRDPKIVFAFDLEGNFVSEYLSIEQCSKSLNINRAAISCVLSNKDGYYQAGDHIFCSKYEEFEEKYERYMNSLPKSIAQYTVDGKLLNYFKSVNAVASFFNTRCNSTIKKCCEGIVKNYKGFIFKYEQVIPSRCNSTSIEFTILDENSSEIYKGVTTDILRVRIMSLIIEYPLYEDYYVISENQPLILIKEFLNSYKRKTTGFQVICNETGKIYDTCRQAAIDLEFDPHAIMKYLNGTRKSPISGKYTFKKYTPND